MNEFNADDLASTFDFFILSGFSNGPLSVPEIQQRVKWAERLLYVAAKRKGKRDAGTLFEALERLQGKGYLKLERQSEQPGAELMCSLTSAGEHRLEQERARRKLLVSNFVEDSELDTSFGKFLDRQNPFWSG